MTLTGHAYKVERHEYVHPGTFVRVTLKCIGKPVEQAHPEGWEYVLLVPADDLPSYHLGRLLRLEVTTR